ncbi:ABC transporter permease [Demequina activiva]|uniref:Transport permease protein n=1 Tax=Demequina activiva TaxID=1582364 RepID=A0A919UFS6_9MICO|nr:ABC transporter permease [Demequina activiva]GIG54042.1 transport permease protein [Demequina activiva]
MTPTDLEALASDNGLERVGARPPLRAYIVQTWRRRDFASTLARYRLQAAMSENRLGMGWVVLRPILNAILFGTIFGVIMPSDTRPDNFVAFLVVGVFIFEYFTKTMSGGANSIVGSKSLVRSLSFPRILLPIAIVIRQFVELIPMLLVMMVILLVVGEPIQWSWLMLVPVMMLMTLFNLGIALITARLTVHVRDLSQIIPLVSRVVFYTSGIFFDLERVLADRQELLTLARLNPVHDFIALVRGYMVTGNPIEPFMWWIAIGAAVVTSSFGLVFFWKGEERYGRD